MFKKKNKKIKRIILLGVLIGLMLSIFFSKKEVFAKTTSNFLQGLMNTIEKNDPIEKMFEGDALKGNIYKNAIKSIDRKSAKTKTIALDKIQFLASGVVLDQTDILNILYYSNPKIQIALDKNCENCKIDQTNITKSFVNILDQLNKAGLCGKNNNLINRNCAKRRINNNFQMIEENQRSIEEFNEESLGEDIFLNGVIEDSDYDLLVDIQNIGNLLFESFIAPVEVVFYGFPPNYAGSNRNIDPTESTNKSKQELTTILQKLLNPGGNNIQTNNIGGTTTETTTSTTTQTNTNTIQQSNILETNDQNLLNFIEENKTFQQTTAQPKNIQGDICTQGVSPGLIKTIEEDIIDPDILEDYLINFQDLIEEYGDIHSNQSTQNIDRNIDGEEINDDKINQIIENFVSSEFEENEYIESCMGECGNLPISERAICVIQCLCLERSRPKYEDIVDMNDMLRLKVCMVPAQSMAIPRGKNIYSLDEILKRIYAVMDNLINGGEMVKNQRTKEVFDNPIADFSRDKIFSFQIKIDFKPMFNNKSKIAKKDKKEKKINDFENKKSSPVNQNKYLVIFDPIKHKVNQEFKESTEDYRNKVNKLKQTSEILIEKNIEIPIINKEKGVTLDIIADFLSKNLAFRKKMESELLNIDIIIDGLQNQL